MRDISVIKAHEELYQDSDKSCRDDGPFDARRERYRGGNTSPKITSNARAAKRKAKAKSQKRNR